MSLKKHVDMAHLVIFERHMKEIVEKQALQTPSTSQKKATKRMFINCAKIVDFFEVKSLTRRSTCFK